jgi:hypothetical protein
MGNCFASGKNGPLKSTTNHTKMHEGLLRARAIDVYEIYEEKEVLGQGSMGHVARVQVREGAEGGSAFHTRTKKTKQGRTDDSVNIHERRKEKADYALKSIQLDLVSPLFLTELENEIDILKGMVSATKHMYVWAQRELQGQLTLEGYHLCRTTPILSGRTKYSITRTGFISFWSCAMEEICTRAYLTRNTGRRRLQAS